MVHPTVPSQEILMAQTMIPSPHAQHLLYFVHEVLQQYRTSSKLCHAGGKGSRSAIYSQTEHISCGLLVSTIVRCSNWTAEACLPFLSTIHEGPSSHHSCSLRNFTKIVHTRSESGSPNTSFVNDLVDCDMFIPMKCYCAQ